MNKGMGLLVLMFAVACCVCAQDSSNSSGSNSSASAPASASSATSARSPLDDSYSAALGTGQAIPLTQGASAQQSSASGNPLIAPELRSEFLYGGTVSTVYVDDYTTNNISHFVSGVVSPYVGVFVPTRTGGLTLQYQGTYTPDDFFSGDFQAYHTLSFNAVGAFTPRWYWGIFSSANYGSATAQFEGPLSYLIVGLTPVVDPAVPADLFLGRTGAFVGNAAEVGWRRSQRDKIVLTAFHSYSDVSSSALAGGLSSNRSNAVGAKLDYSRDVTSRIKFDVFAQDEHVIESNCNLYGGGVGISAKLSYSWHLDASGGPQWTSGCGRQTNFNAYGALVKSLRGQAKFYIVGWQYYNASFLATNTTQGAAAVGISQPLGTTKFIVEGNGGYFYGDPLLIAAKNFQGYFLAPLVRYKLSENTSISAGYRLFHATGGNTVPGNLHFATISIEWHPKPFRLGR